MSSPKAGDGGPQDLQLEGGPGGPGGPGGSGKVAAVSGSTAQVQNATGQVAVSWTPRTTFTQEVASQAQALEVGDCVVALPAMPTAGGSGEDQDDTESADEGETGPLTAATVRISAPVGGSCDGGVRREQGPGGETQPPPPADDGPDDGEPPRDGLRRVQGRVAIGEVTAVSGSGFTVESARPEENSTSTEVTTTAETRWTTTRPATARAVVVGRCVTSIGSPDSTGAITAESIAVSAPVDGECALGFGGARVVERDS